MLDYVRMRFKRFLPLRKFKATYSPPYATPPSTPPPSSIEFIHICSDRIISLSPSRLSLSLPLSHMNTHRTRIHAHTPTHKHAGDAHKHTIKCTISLSFKNLHLLSLFLFLSLTQTLKHAHTQTLYLRGTTQCILVHALSLYIDDDSRPTHFPLFESFDSKAAENRKIKTSFIFVFETTFSSKSFITFKNHCCNKHEIVYTVYLIASGIILSCLKCLGKF